MLARLQHCTARHAAALPCPSNLRIILTKLCQRALGAEHTPSCQASQVGWDRTRTQEPYEYAGGIGSITKDGGEVTLANVH